MGRINFEQMAKDTKVPIQDLRALLCIATPDSIRHADSVEELRDMLLVTPDDSPLLTAIYERGLQIADSDENLWKLLRIIPVGHPFRATVLKEILVDVHDIDGLKNYYSDPTVVSDPLLLDVVREVEVSLLGSVEELVEFSERIRIIPGSGLQTRFFQRWFEVASNVYQLIDLLQKLVPGSNLEKRVFEKCLDEISSLEEIRKLHAIMKPGCEFMSPTLEKYLSIAKESGFRGDLLEFFSILPSDSPLRREALIALSRFYSL